MFKKLIILFYENYIKCSFKALCCVVLNSYALWIFYDEASHSEYHQVYLLRWAKQKSGEGELWEEKEEMILILKNK